MAKKSKKPKSKVKQIPAKVGAKATVGKGGKVEVILPTDTSRGEYKKLTKKQKKEKEIKKRLERAREDREIEESVKAQLGIGENISTGPVGGRIRNPRRGGDINIAFDKNKTRTGSEELVKNETIGKLSNEVKSLRDQIKQKSNVELDEQRAKILLEKEALEEERKNFDRENTEVSRLARQKTRANLERGLEAKRQRDIQKEKDRKDKLPSSSKFIPLTSTEDKLKLIKSTRRNNPNARVERSRLREEERIRNQNKPSNVVSFDSTDESDFESEKDFIDVDKFRKENIERAERINRRTPTEKTKTEKLADLSVPKFSTLEPENEFNRNIDRIRSDNARFQSQNVDRRPAPEPEPEPTRPLRLKPETKKLVEKKYEEFARKKLEIEDAIDDEKFKDVDEFEDVNEDEPIEPATPEQISRRQQFLQDSESEQKTETAKKNLRLEAEKLRKLQEDGDNKDAQNLENKLRLVNDERVARDLALAEARKKDLKINSNKILNELIEDTVEERRKRRKKARENLRNQQLSELTDVGIVEQAKKVDSSLDKLLGVALAEATDDAIRKLPRKSSGLQDSKRRDTLKKTTSSLNPMSDENIELFLEQQKDIQQTKDKLSIFGIDKTRYTKEFGTNELNRRITEDVARAKESGNYNVSDLTALKLLLQKLTGQLVSQKTLENTRRNRKTGNPRGRPRGGGRELTEEEMIAQRIREREQQED